MKFGAFDLPPNNKHPPTRTYTCACLHTHIYTHTHTQHYWGWLKLFLKSFRNYFMLFVSISVILLLLPLFFFQTVGMCLLFRVGVYYGLTYTIALGLLVSLCMGVYLAVCLCQRSWRVVSVFAASIVLSWHLKDALTITNCARFQRRLNILKTARIA